MASGTDQSSIVGGEEIMDVAMGKHKSESAHDFESNAEEIQQSEIETSEADASEAEIDLAEQEVFKGNVKRYLEIHDQIAQMTKSLSAMKKEKIACRDSVLHFMKRYEIDQCVAENSKLYIATSRTSQAVNKAFISAFLSESLGESEAHQLVDLMWKNRKVTEKQTLRQSKLTNNQVDKIRKNI